MFRMGPGGGPAAAPAVPEAGTAVRERPALRSDGAGARRLLAHGARDPAGERRDVRPHLHLRRQGGIARRPGRRARSQGRGQFHRAPLRRRGVAPADHAHLHGARHVAHDDARPARSGRRDRGTAPRALRGRAQEARGRRSAADGRDTPGSSPTTRRWTACSSRIASRCRSATSRRRSGRSRSSRSTPRSIPSSSRRRRATRASLSGGRGLQPRPGRAEGRPSFGRAALSKTRAR